MRSLNKLSLLIILTNKAMFNPQRKSKVSDIFFEQKFFQLHLDKIRQIRKSNSPKSLRQNEEKLQQKYLNRLHHNKQEVKDRIHGQINRENHRLFTKLIETDCRPEENPQRKDSKKHFHSYFSTKRNIERIRQQNYGLINRMIQQSAMVPNLQEMKKQFKQSQRYGKMVRKLPAIMKHEEQYRRDLSIKRLTDSKTSLRTSRNGSMTERATTQQVNHIETELIHKE